MKEYSSYLDLCKHYASWLEKKPRQRIVRCITKDGNYFALYWSEAVNLTDSGVAIHYENEKLVPILYPLCLPYEQNNHASLDVSVNVVNVLIAEHSYSGENRLTFVTTERYPTGKCTVRTLVDKNKWNDTEIG